MKRAIVLFAWLAAAGGALGQRFSLRDESGAVTGPYELKSGTEVAIGDTRAFLADVRTQRDAIKEQMREIVIPHLEFQQASIREVLAALQQAAAEHDPKKRALGFVLELTPEQEAAAKTRPITLALRNATLLDALRTVTDLAGLSYRLRGSQVRVVPADAPVDDLITRLLPPSPEFLWLRWQAFTNTMEEKAAVPLVTWRRFFTELGVSWPPGSSITYSPSARALVVCNTAENHRYIRALLSDLHYWPCCVKVDAQFVAYDLTNIARVAASGIRLDSLVDLWTNGFGQLLAAQTVVTKSGQEAVVKGVTEIIYPTEFTRGVPPATNMADGACQWPPVLPAALEMRETGSILQVVPEIAPDWPWINLSFCPQVVEPPVWHAYGDEVPAGIARTAPIEQPFFHVYSTATGVSAYSGRRILVSGGMPTHDGKKLVYLFVTATLVDPAGRPMPVPDAAETRWEMLEP
jgi:hypothetical protein